MARFLVIEAATALHLATHSGFAVEEAHGVVDGGETHTTWKDASFSWNGYLRGPPAPYRA